MGRTTVLLGVLASLVTWAAAQPRGACTRDIDTERVMDMCEGGSWMLGRFYISISSTTMGDNSKCNCTLRGRTKGQNTATEFRVWQMGNSTEDCITSHVTMVGWPPDSNGNGAGSQNFTCDSGGTINSPPLSTLDVILTQLRSDPATIFSYCLHVQPHIAESNLELVCWGGTGASHFSSTSTTPTPATSSLSSPSSPPGTSTWSPGTSKSSTVSKSGAATIAGNEVTDDVMTTSKVVTPDGRAHTPYPSYSAVVAVAVVGWLLVLVLAVLVLVFCLRQQRMSTSSSGPGAENSAYTSLSDVTRSYPRADPNYSVIQSEGSSSQQGGGDSADPRGVYESVGEVSSGLGRDHQEREGNNISGTYCNA